MSEISRGRPTDNAKTYFKIAQMQFDDAYNNWWAAPNQTPGRYGQMNMATGLKSLAFGLNDLSIGLRATYMLLEQIDRKLQK